MAEGLRLKRLRRLRQILGLTFGNTSIGPAHDPLHLFGGQRLIVTEFAEPFDRAPGGHPAAKNFFLDRDGPGPRVRVRHQGESGAARMMTGSAVAVYDARNIPA